MAMKLNEDTKRLVVTFWENRRDITYKQYLDLLNIVYDYGYMEAQKESSSFIKEVSGSIDKLIIKAKEG